MNTTESGLLGELIAAAYLRLRGLDVLERRYRAAGAEIDIVARDDRTLVFVEVKLRKAPGKAPGRTSVGVDKQRRIARAATAYLATLPLTSSGQGAARARFDVVELTVSREGMMLVHIRDAFRPGHEGGRWSTCWRRS